MSIQCPILQRFISDFNNHIVNLAVFGLLFSISLFFEGIIIPFFPATVALVKSHSELFRVRFYALYFSSIVALVFSTVFYFDSIFNLVFIDALNLDPLAISIIKKCGIIFISPLLVGYRRFYQGLLVIQDKNSYITFGTIFRIIAMVFTFITLNQYVVAPSAVLAITALISGYAAEALFIRIGYAFNKIKFQSTAEESSSLSYKDIFKFHYPLALNTAVSISSQPLILFLLSKGENALVSLALYPVLANFVFLCGCPVKAMLELIINIARKTCGKLQEVKKFHTGIAIVILAFMFFTPCKFIFDNFYGLDENSINTVSIAYYLLPFLPALEAMLVWRKACFMTEKRTLIITVASYLELGLTLLILSFLVFMMQPLMAAFISRIVARACAVAYLLMTKRNCKD